MSADASILPIKPHGILNHEEHVDSSREVLKYMIKLVTVRPIIILYLYNCELRTEISDCHFLHHEDLADSSKAVVLVYF